jgi:glycosyltransferase involved in cell wall biosynthesis
MDVLVLSEVRWGYFRTRKQFLLSRFPERWRVFFAQPPAFGADDPWEPRREGNVTYFTVPFLKPGTTSRLYNGIAAVPAGRALIEAVAAQHLRRMLRRLGVEPEPVVIASNVYCAGALSRLPRKLLFYDFNDSPFQFAAAPGWAGGYWRRTLAQVDAIFVVSEYYRRELSAQTDRPLILLGNGVEHARFAAPRAVPPELAALPRPRIGYLGLLSHFLDFELLEALRRARRGGTLVLLGPGDPATEGAVRALAAREGVAVPGPRPYEEVPAWLQGLDVGVIPFRAGVPHVQGINPNKVYQYLAAGLPVVTTPVLDLEPAPPALQFAAGIPEWERAVAHALDQPRDADACRALALPHDWDRLAARMVAEIERRAGGAAAGPAPMS